MLNRVDAQVPNLLERPATETTGELLVPRLYGSLVTGTLDLGIDPLVLKSLGGAHDGEAGRISCLES